MNIVTKDYPVLDVEDGSATGSFEVILSAPTLDRENEVVEARCFEPLPDHITFDTDHSMTCDSVVGSGVPSYSEDGTLLVKGTYCADERSQTIRQKVKDGHIRSTSVTFMAAERDKDEKGVVHIKRAELLNGTFTPVPSNREAVVLTAKSIVAKAGRRNSTADMGHIQAAHDALTALGATCAAKHVRDADGKAVVDSVEALQERVADALEDTYPRACYPRGVLPDAGTCVFDTWSADYELETYSQTYTDDGSVVTLTGDPVEVDVMEIVTPNADAARDEQADLGKSASDSAEAVTAASAEGKDADTETEMQARLRVNENAALIAFGA